MRIFLCLIVLLFLIKIVIVLSGYLVCFIITKLKKKNSNNLYSINKFKAQEINSGKTKYKNDIDISKSLIKKLKNYLSRLINGWLRYSILFTGKIPSHVIRNFLYRSIYHLNMEKKVIIYGGAEIRAPYNIKIGEGTIIGDNSILDGRNGIVIGKNVNISTGVWMWTEQHNPQDPNFTCINEGAPIIINDRAWLSCRTVILPGVTIGEGAVIAAGAVVTKDVEPYGIYAGIPAKKIGERNRNLVYEFDGKYLPFY